MGKEERPNLLPLVQNAINKSLSPQRGNVCPLTAFSEMEAPMAVSSFSRKSLLYLSRLSSYQLNERLKLKLYGCEL